MSSAAGLSAGAGFSSETGFSSGFGADFSSGAGSGFGSGFDSAAVSSFIGGSALVSLGESLGGSLDLAASSIALSAAAFSSSIALRAASPPASGFLAGSAGAISISSISTTSSFTFWAPCGAQPAARVVTMARQAALFQTRWLTRYDTTLTPGERTIGIGTWDAVARTGRLMIDRDPGRENRPRL